MSMDSQDPRARAGAVSRILEGILDKRLHVLVDGKELTADDRPRVAKTFEGRKIADIRVEPYGAAKKLFISLDDGRTLELFPVGKIEITKPPKRRSRRRGRR